MIEQTVPKISVIICAYTMDRYDDTIEAVESVLAQTLKPHEVILVIDSNEDLYNKCKYELSPNVKVILSNNARGLCPARNVGIHAASGDIIAFLDDDAVADSNWLESISGAFRNPSVMAVSGQSTPNWPGRKPPFWFPEELDFIVGCTNHKKLILQSNGEVRNVSGSNMAFRTEVFSKIGLWSTQIGAVGQKSKGGEEAELCLRLKHHLPQAILLYVPGAIVYHKVPPERAKLRWCIDYCINEGVTRSNLKRLSNKVTGNPLKAENTFVRRLAFCAIPQRLVRFYRPSSAAQVFVIILSTGLIGLGFLKGRLDFG